jgi:hypothetical protein
MTPSEINQAIRQRYNAVGDDFFSNQLVWDLIYQAQMIMANECFAIERKYTSTSTAGTRELDYPTSAIAIRRVEYDGEKLAPVSIDQDPKTSTTEVTGDPRQYAIWNNEIILYPTPSATGDTITIYTYNEPQPVTSSSTLEVPTEYHLAIIDFGLSIFYAKDGNPQMAQYHDNRWREQLERIKRTRAKKKRGDQLAVVRDAEDVPNIYGQFVRG